MDIGRVRRVIQVELEPTPSLVEVEAEADELADVEEEADER